MSETAKPRKLRKKKHSESEASETLVKDFINSPSEPKPKKVKHSSSVEADLDDSLKFFKAVKKKVPKTSSDPSQSSNLAINFINETTIKNSQTPSTSKVKAKTSGKVTKRKPKAQPDIRKVLSKHDQLFHDVVTKNCLQEGIDPEEMQMALAMSESLKDQNQTQDQPSTSKSQKFKNPFTSQLGSVKSISSKLEKFGFKCNKNYTEYEINLITNSKVSKRSKFQKFPTLLTRTSNEQRSKITSLKVDRVLEESLMENSTDFSDEPRFEFKVFSSFLQDLQEISGSAFDMSRESRSADEALMSYYVTDLFEVSFVQAGHLLKDWRKIPGRDATPERDGGKEKEVEEVLEDGKENSDQEKLLERDEEENVEEIEVLVERETENPSIQNVEENELENLSQTSSCMDIFADLDEEVSGGDIRFDEASEDEIIILSDSPKKTSGELAGNLSLLHEKLSQSIMNVECGEGIDEEDLIEENSRERKALIVNVSGNFEDENQTKIPVIQLISDKIHEKASEIIFQSHKMNRKNDEIQDISHQSFKIPVESSRNEKVLIKIHENSINREEKSSNLEQNSVNLGENSINLEESSDEDIEIQKNLETSIEKLENFILAQPDEVDEIDLTQPETSTKFEKTKINLTLSKTEAKTSIEIDLTQLETSSNSKNNLTHSDVSKIHETNEIDLTQPESSIDHEFTIPFDDSYHTLKKNIKKIFGSSQIPEVQSSTTSEISPVQIDLMSSEDEEEKVESDMEDSIDEMFSQNSSTFDEDEVIAISDEEINYSMGKYLRKSEDLSQEVDEAETVDLTQINQENFEFEIENRMDQSLIDVMEEEAIDINNTIADLLEEPIMFTSAKKDRSMKFHESNGLSDSLMEIMQKYGGSSKPESSRSFRKIQSESQLVDESVKKRKSVQFHFDDVVDSTQPIEDEDLMDFDKSIDKSLENVVRYSPAVSRKRSLQKKSLGVQIDDDYIVDTESVVAEPDFRNMTPVELKQELFKYGIRSLPVKKAVELLEFIYDQLHPEIRSAADEEFDVNDSRRELNITDIATNIGVQDCDEFVFEPGIIDGEDFVLPKIKKSKGSSCAIPLHISFYNMVRSNEKVQKFILEYRPVELDQIHKHFRKFGLSYELNDIISFLDRRCITFKTKEKSYSKTHEKKKLKKAQKLQKQSQKKQK